MIGLATKYSKCLTRSCISVWNYHQSSSTWEKIMKYFIAFRITSDINNRYLFDRRIGFHSRVVVTYVCRWDCWNAVCLWSDVLSHVHIRQLLLQCTLFITSLTLKIMKNIIPVCLSVCMYVCRSCFLSVSLSGNNVTEKRTNGFSLRFQDRSGIEKGTFRNMWGYTISPSPT